MSDRDVYIEKMKNQLDKMNASIDLFEERVKSTADSTRATLETKLAEAKAQRERVEHKLSNLRNAGEGAWDKAKGEVEHAWGAFKHSVNYFKAHFK